METLHWRHRGIFRQTVEIFADSDLYGRLKFLSNVYPIDKWNKAQAETPQQKWLFLQDQRAGILNLLKNEFSIRDTISGSVLAVYRYRSQLKFKTEGELTFVAGATYIFQFNSLTANKFLTIVGSNKEPLLVSTIKYKLFRQPAGDIEILPTAKMLPELPLLVLFGQYMSDYMRQSL